MTTAQTIARHLLRAGAVKLQPTEPFTWASGLRSPIYCDNRVLLSYPAIRTDVITAFVAASKGFTDVHGIAGVATAGIPHGALLADRLGLPFLYIRSQAKAHGRQNQIEGRLETGKRYLVVEDLISTGGSSLKAIEALRAAGGEVAGAVAIMSYEFSSALEAFDRAGIPLTTLSGYDALLQEAAAEGYIPQETVATLTGWRADPRAWSDDFQSKK